MKNDLKIVQISEANNGYIVTLLTKDKVSELSRECKIYIAEKLSNAIDMCFNFMAGAPEEKADE